MCESVCVRVREREGIYNISIRLTHTNVWESMGKLCSYAQFIKSHRFYYKSRENPYQVLQVTCTASKRATQLKVRMIKSLSPNLYRKKSHPFVAIGIVTCAAHSSDGNRLVILYIMLLSYKPSITLHV